MQKNSNRRGLALGAIFALVASLFVSAPAQAATDGANIGIYPVAENGTTTSAFVGTLVDDFPIYAQAKPGNASLTNSTVVVKIEKTAGTNMDVVVSTSLAVVNASTATTLSPAAPSADHLIQAGSTSTTVSAKINAAGIVHLNFKASSASGLASWSAVTLKVTVFQDIQGGVSNDIINSDEWFTTQTISLVHPKDLTRTLTADALAVGTTGVTVSSTVTDVNLANLSGGFRLAYSTSASTSFVGSAVSATDAHLRGGVVSGSVSITPITGTEKYEFLLTYAGDGTPALTSGALATGTVRVGALVAATATKATATALVVEVEEGADAVSSSGDTTSGLTYAVRTNRTYNVTVTVLSNSATVSAEALQVAISGPALSVAEGKTISIDGGASTTSYPTKLALTSGANGKVSFTLTSVGLDTTGNDFVVTAKSAVSNLTKTATLVRTAATFDATPEYANYATTPGTAVKIVFDVEDQWGVASDRTNQRVKITRGGAGFNYSETISYVAVSAGKATLDFTAQPSTKTGSASVAAIVQAFNADTNVWADVANSTVKYATINVTDKANAFTGSALASVSVSISYAAASGKYSWSANSLTIKSVNAGADIAISAPGVFFLNTADSKTYSATATIRANGSGELSLKFATTKAGKHTISYTVGSSTTTSQLIVTEAQVQDASKIAISGSLLPGQTNVMTGTLTDTYGNPVATTADKKVSVEWTGKGLPFNTGSISTDEDGKFTFQVLVLSGETGTGTAKATFKPTSVAAQDITVTTTLTIVAPVVPAAPEVNAVIGSFNNRVAVRVENAKGAAVSVKVGARWFKYTSLNDNYLYTVRSAKGRTVAVAVYVNGTLENVATITVK